MINVMMAQQMTLYKYNTFLFSKPSEHHFEKLWKIGTLRVPRRVHPWCPGVEFDLLWTSSVAKGCASGRLGSSTPSAPLERKVFLGMDRLRIRCCWPLPMLGSNKPIIMRGKSQSSTKTCERSCEDEKIFWN